MSKNRATDIEAVLVLGDDFYYYVCLNKRALRRKIRKNDWKSARIA